MLDGWAKNQEEDFTSINDLIEIRNLLFLKKGIDTNFINLIKINQSKISITSHTLHTLFYRVDKIENSFFNILHAHKQKLAHFYGYLGSVL